MYHNHTVIKSLVINTDNSSLILETMMYIVLGDNNQDIIMWMDHRAEKQAEAINSTQHTVLKYVGGKQSLEMQTPKLLWLKQVTGSRSQYIHTSCIQKFIQYLIKLLYFRI